VGRFVVEPIVEENHGNMVGQARSPYTIEQQNKPMIANNLESVSRSENYIR
jgi:hypothetical protein